MKYKYIYRPTLCGLEEELNSDKYVFINPVGNVSYIEHLDMYVQLVRCMEN